MIESHITLLPRNQINLDTSRLRELDEAHARGLAEDIAIRDLIHIPIIDKPSGNIIAGLHRCKAFEINEFLGRPCPNEAYQSWSVVPIRYSVDATETEILAMELMENVQAKRMDWKEIARGILRLERTFEKAPYGSDLAALTGMSESKLSDYRRAAKYLEAGHELVLAATSLKGAMNVIMRAEERELDSLVETITVGEPAAEAPLAPQPNEDWEIPDATSQTEETESTHEPEAPQAFQSVNADFLEWSRTYSGPRFNLLHCDLPYGIDYDKSGFDYARHHSIYSDSKDLYFQLLAAIVDSHERLLAKSCHVIFWYDARYRSETIAAFESIGFKPWPHHLIWHKSDNAGVLADYRRGPRHTHETALFLTRGDRKIVKPVADSVSAQTTRESGHVSEKPLAVLQHFYQLVVDSTTRVLDPTAGSFNSLLAAQAAGAESGVGVELDADYAARGRRLLATRS